MGKVDTPRETQFFKKMFFALLILLGFVVVAQFFLITLGYTASESFQKAIEIVTHVGVATEQIGFKYVFVLLGIMGDVVQFYLIYVILEYLLEGKFKDIFSGVRHMNKVKKMKNHYIIAGGGRVGSHSAESLKSYTENVVVVDNDEKTIQKLRKMGYTAVKGDLLDENFLKEINVDKAKHLIACLGRDSDNILLILSTRELNPGIKISARANSESTVQKLKHAGASHVIVPSSIGGEELAKWAARS